jgi:HAD superfamily hydrolase (TIGR01459 family)
MNAAEQDRNPELLKGIGGLVDRYDAFIFDIWGVLHDGIRPFEGVIECLEELKRQNKEVLLLTNSPNRAEMVAIGVLKNMGIYEERHYDHLISSGEAAWASLHDRQGEKAYGFWSLENPTALEGHDISPTNDINEADFMFASLLPAGAQESDFQEALNVAYKKGLELYCANPDKYVSIGESLHLCAGAIGDLYEELGGKVHWFGKPYAPIYDQAFDLLSVKEKSKILAVGDSLRTDVRGANAADIDVLWNLVGIHWEELRHKNADGSFSLHMDRLEASMHEYDAAPTALLRGLKL